MKITLLGTGTPTPSLKRAGSGYMFEINNQVILMDHGPGAFQRLLQTGKRPQDITHVFFSHLHYDHCMDYARLVLQRWDMGADNIPDLFVYGPAPIKRMSQLLFESDGVFGPDIQARIEHQGSIDIFEKRGGKIPRRRPTPAVVELQGNESIDGDGWTIRISKASHVQPFLECLCFRIDTEQGSVCYSGDSGGVCRDVIRLAEKCDVLIHMVHYMSGTEPTDIYRQVCGNPIDTAIIAREAGVGTLIISHALEQIDQPGIREQVLKEMMNIYEGNIIWGEDLMEIPLKGPYPALMR